MMVDAEPPEENFLEKLLDPEDKLKKWTLTSSPYPVFTILILYLLFVLKLGPSIMKSRPPIGLQTTMRLYNLLQVLANVFIILRVIVDPALIIALVKTQCSLEELHNGEYKNEKDLMLWYGWTYFFLKITDLLDTVFMVLRKKNSHITFLHVYHHTAMVFFVWLCFRYSKTHHSVIPVLINLVIHVVMYSYYFLATFPVLKERLWWKKHLTKLQLGQFITILLYFTVLYYKECYIPRIFTYIWMFNVSVFSILFMNFYIQAYMKQSSLK